MSQVPVRLLDGITASALHSRVPRRCGRDIVLCRHPAKLLDGIWSARPHHPAAARGTQSGLNQWSGQPSSTYVGPHSLRLSTSSPPCTPPSHSSHRAWPSKGLATLVRAPSSHLLIASTGLPPRLPSWQGGSGSGRASQAQPWVAPKPLRMQWQRWVQALLSGHRWTLRERGARSTQAWCCCARRPAWTLCSSGGAWAPGARCAVWCSVVGRRASFWTTLNTRRSDR